METLNAFFSELSWSPYVVGIGIGILSWLSFLISGKPLATSTTFAQMGGMIEKAISGEEVKNKPYYKKIKLEINWQSMLVVGVVIGAFLSALISGDFQMRWLPTLWSSTFGSDVMTRLLVAMGGGVFLGFGARWAGGCTSGHGISGTLQLAVSSWISAICFFIGGILTAWLIFNILA